jgi:hypothetical protein
VVESRCRRAGAQKKGFEAWVGDGEHGPTIRMAVVQAMKGGRRLKKRAAGGGQIPPQQPKRVGIRPTQGIQVMLKKLSQHATDSNVVNSSKV